MNPAMCTPLRVNLREVRFETRTVGIATKYQIQVDRKGLYPSLDRMLRIRTFFAASVLKSAFSKETKILTKKRNLHWTSGPDPVKVRIRGFVTKFAGQGQLPLSLPLSFFPKSQMTFLLSNKKMYIFNWRLVQFLLILFSFIGCKKNLSAFLRGGGGGEDSQ